MKDHTPLLAHWDFRIFFAYTLVWARQPGGKSCSRDGSLQTMFLSIELDLKISGASVREEWKLAREKCVNCEDRWSKKSEMSEQKQNRLSEKKENPLRTCRCRE